MARSAGTRRSGPGYAGLIIFIVLCMALIGGYVWLVPEYTFAVSEMVRLNSDIKNEMEARVGSQLGVHAQATTKRSERAYDTGFLRQVGDSAEDGLKYAELVELCGWEGDNPGEGIRDFLKSNPEIGQQENLRAFFSALNTKLMEREELRISAEQGRQKALADLNEALERKTAADARAVAAEREKNDKLAEAEAKFNKDRNRYIEQMDETNAQAAQARKARDEDAQKHREEVRGLNEQIESLNDRVVELETELAKKKPKPVKVTEGKVLEAHNESNFVIINLGKREGIIVGEIFTVMHLGPGASRTPKATLQVTRVMDVVSRADITAVVPGSEIVVPQDIVVREKTVND